MLHRGSSAHSPWPWALGGEHTAQPALTAVPGREGEQHRAPPTSTRRQELAARKNTEGIYEHTGTLDFAPNCTSNEYGLTTERVNVCESLCVCACTFICNIYI